MQQCGILHLQFIDNIHIFIIFWHNTVQIVSDILKFVQVNHHLLTLSHINVILLVCVGPLALSRHINQTAGCLHLRDSLQAECEYLLSVKTVGVIVCVCFC